MKRKLIRRNKQFWTKVLQWINSKDINVKTYYALRESEYYYHYYKNNNTTILNINNHNILD